MNQRERKRGAHSLPQSIRLSMASWGDKKQRTTSVAMKEMETSQRLKESTEYLTRIPHTPERKKARRRAEKPVRIGYTAEFLLAHIESTKCRVLPFVR